MYFYLLLTLSTDFCYLSLNFRSSLLLINSCFLNIIFLAPKIFDHFQFCAEFYNKHFDFILCLTISINHNSEEIP